MKTYKKPQCISYSNINNIVPLAVGGAAASSVAAGIAALGKVSVGAAALAGVATGLKLFGGDDISLIQKKGLTECIVD